MPFSLTNTPATFQSWVDDCLRAYIDDFVESYIADIPIHSTNEKETEEHVRQVQQRLQEDAHYWKAEQSLFGISEVGFLGVVITPEGIGMEFYRISTFQDWPTPKSRRNVQMLLRFTNFYRRFIRQYAKVTLPRTDLQQETDNPGEPPKDND